MTDYANLSDQALQSAAVSGDADAEEALAKRYARTVRICARPLFLSGGDSEDLIQEGMFGLLAAIRSFDPAANVSFKTYAELCISRRLYSAVKSASCQKHLPLNCGIPLESILSEESRSQSASYAEAHRRITEEQVLARESEKELHSAFSTHLSAFERTVLQLFLKGLSYSEMAAKTQKPMKSIDNAVQRIRRKLARLPNFSDISKS